VLIDGGVKRLRLAHPPTMPPRERGGAAGVNATVVAWT
jgi:hypothetical protein